MPISKVKSGSITDSAVTSDKINNSAVTSAKIQDGSIVNADINACAAIASSKLTVDTTALETDINTNKFNISLLGFKMAVNEGLTVFNLIDGVVDEFNDESGTDEAEGSNDLYCGTSDYYINSTIASGTSAPAVSAGFTTTTITEPDTSVAGTNPALQVASTGTFTVPGGVTSVNVKAWGAGGGSTDSVGEGGGGGFTTANLAVSGGQVLHIGVAEGGGGWSCDPGPFGNNIKGGAFGGGTILGSDDYGGGGGGFAMIAAAPLSVCSPQDLNPSSFLTPNIYTIACGGGGGSNQGGGGAAGGLTGDAGNSQTEQTSNAPSAAGGGGDQEQGGQGGTAPAGTAGQTGAFMYGGTGAPQNGGGGGGGYFGGGGGGSEGPTHGGGGGGSSYTGHPQLTCASTEEGAGSVGGGTSDPDYVAGTNEGALSTFSPGEDGYVLITACAVCASTTSTTIVSTAFTSTSVPTSARIVVFEENVETPTLNTDIIASISRDGGTTFTNATLSDSGYVTGSSGQRILTGQATISGQPSGQSMRWKLALANNAVKIHGVSLQWA